MDLRDKIANEIRYYGRNRALIVLSPEVVADRILTLLATESEAVSQYLASVEEVDPPL